MADATQSIEELERKLSGQEIDYVHEYIKNGNKPAPAAIKAGYAKTTANAKAHSWIKETIQESAKPNLFLYYKALIDKKREEFDIDINEIVEELKSIGFSNITDIVSDMNGFKMKMKTLEEIPDKVKPAIQSISKTSYGLTVKMHNKLDALKFLFDLKKDDVSNAKGSITIGTININVRGSASKLLDEPSQE